MNSLNYLPKHLLPTTIAVLFVFGLTLFLVSANIAQSNIPMAMRPGSPAGSSSLSGFETINPYSGNLNFSLPLASSGGRGTNGLEVRLNIAQKVRTKIWYDENDGGREYPYIDPENVWDQFVEYDRGYYPAKIHGINIGFQPNPYCPGGGNIYTTTSTILTFTAPDGTQYELRDRVYGGAPFNNGCGLNGLNRGKIFDSTDGSHMVFISDDNVFDRVEAGYDEYMYRLAPTGKLITKDGTIYRMEGGRMTWSQDRNGNRTTVSYGTTVSDAMNFVITDSNNRQLSVEIAVQESSPYGLCDRITYKGTNGATRIVRVSYQNIGNILRSGYSLQTGVQLFPNNFVSFYPSYWGGTWDGTTIYNPLKPSTVWLPDGRHYDFQYNSYGEIARVQLPTGGVYEYDWGV